MKQITTTQEGAMNQAADQTMAAAVAEQRTWTVAKVFGRDVTWGALHDAFERVQNRTNWKNPVRAEVVISSDFEMETIREAVAFFTGSVATISFVRHSGSTGGRYRVTAPGYYKAVGA